MILPENEKLVLIVFKKILHKLSQMLGNFGEFYSIKECFNCNFYYPQYHLYCAMYIMYIMLYMDDTIINKLNINLLMWPLRFIITS